MCLTDLPDDFWALLLPFLSLQESQLLFKPVNTQTHRLVTELETRVCTSSFSHSPYFVVYRCPCQIKTSFLNFCAKLTFVPRRLWERARQAQKVRQRLGLGPDVRAGSLERQFVQNRFPIQLTMCVNCYLVVFLSWQPSLTEMRVLEAAFLNFGIYDRDVDWLCLKRFFSVKVKTPARRKNNDEQKKIQRQ